MWWLRITCFERRAKAPTNDMFPGVAAPIRTKQRTSKLLSQENKMVLSLVSGSSSLFPAIRRSLLGAYSTSAKSKPHSKQHANLKTNASASEVTPPKEASQNSSDDRVLLGEVKAKVLEILEKEGPVSRRKIYDDHLSKMFRLSPFTPNPPPRPLWMRSQYSPEEERVYLTMSKFKRRLIRGLVKDGSVAVMTVAKIKRLIEEIDETEKREDILIRKTKMERAVASETDKTFVWILEHWVTLLKQQAVNKALNQAAITGRPVASRFKRA
ncbi:hypothetical protein O181_006160 [Austropuccinia psidii MF-1]|uniref:Uncharacterized protein n=1 Tax=Austropuccinia psidii MF-1 TaxID=1389203 RepID=A0A9Q3BJU1_9BASI|nr:hypothetical protein [Austropuccinia psidii MF-1]